MNKIWFLVFLGFLLVGCGNYWSSREMETKNRALEISKVGTFTVVGSGIHPSACWLFLESESKEKVDVMFSIYDDVGWNNCMAVRHSGTFPAMVKVTFRDVAANFRVQLGHWLIIERLPASPSRS